MSYGAKEHAYNLRRIGDVQRDLDAAQEIVRSVRVDVMQDIPIDGKDARNFLREASIRLGSVMEALDKAVATLPTPAR